MVKYSAPSPIDAFIATYPSATQKLLLQVKKTIKKAAPEAEEVIGYGIPTFKLFGKNLVHFSGYKNHIGFYPGPSGLKQFQKEISGYAHSKGAVQFTLDKPIPLDLIERIVVFRVEENRKQYEAAIDKKTLRSCKEGHQYRKTSDCPSCPICEAKRQPAAGFLSELSAPAKRALEKEGITTAKKLAQYSESQLLSLHGVGPSTIPKLKTALKKEGFSLRT